LDIFIRSDEEKLQPGISRSSVRRASQQSNSIRLYGWETFQIGQPPARIDILQQTDGITFDEVWENRIEGLVDGQIKAARHIQRLIRNKLVTGQEQDILDFKKLRAASQSNPN
jgi:hypothetical protein